MTNTVGIRRYDYIEFYVGSAKMVAYWFSKAMGLKITATKGLRPVVVIVPVIYLRRSN